MDAQLKKQLAQTIYIASPASVDAFGQITYDPPVATPARVENFGAVTSGSRGGAIEVEDGEEKSTKMLIITETAITIMDRVWLPGVDQTNAALARRPLSVLALPDEKGAIDHYETRL